MINRTRSILFEISVGVMFLIVIANCLLNIFVVGKKILFHYLSSADQGAIIGMIGMTILSLILVPRLSLYVHEIGHWIIYRLAGTRAKIRIVSRWKMRTKAVDEKGNMDERFEKNLMTEKPGLYLVLCMAGVIFPTLTGIVLTALLCILTRNHIAWYSGYILVFVTLFNLFVVAEYPDNMWTKKTSSDGSRAREVLKRETYGEI